MKKMIAAIGSLLLMVTVSMAQATQPAKPAGEKKATEKKAEKKAATPKSDAEIQKCITDRFAAGASLKDQGLSATVSGGVATLTGTAKNGGSKGAATKIAKSCGAKSVTNNITVAAKPKPAKPETKKAEPKKAEPAKKP